MYVCVYMCEFMYSAGFMCFQLYARWPTNDVSSNLPQNVVYNNDTLLACKNFTQTLQIPSEVHHLPSANKEELTDTLES